MTKPMLAATLKDLSKLKYPILVSPKLDGIRCLIRDGVAFSRSLKPIPNKHIQKLIGMSLFNGLDGELILANRDEDFNSVQSAVMSEDGEPDFIYCVFDIWQDDNSLQPFRSFEYRYNKLMQRGLKLPRFVKVVEHHIARSEADLLVFEEEFVGLGYEGIMIRSFDGPYKHGRSTENEGYLLKLKRFKDAEATVVGFTERFHNANEAKKNELGHTERSHHKANMVPTNSLGTFIVEFNNKQFEIGTGLTEDQRNEFWKIRDKLFGKLVKFKYQDLSKYGVPRFPVFLGFRDERDL